MPASSYLKKTVKGLINGTLVRKEPVYVPKFQGSLLEGRSALVTGGTGGIGYAIAEAFLANGAEVVITGRSQRRVDAAAERLNEGLESGRAHGMALDSSDPKAIQEEVPRCESLTSSGRIDILVNNAGVLRGGPLGAVTAEDFDAVMAVNLRGTFLLSQEVARRMVEQGVKGNILNIASSSSLRPAVSPYTMSKWGVRGLTLGLAKALIPHGIVVNGLAPGPTATPMLLGDDAGHLENDRVPAGRYAAPEEIANMAVVLTSSLGRMVVGDIVYMTGGSGLITYDDTDYGFVTEG